MEQTEALEESRREAPEASPGAGVSRRGRWAATVAGAAALLAVGGMLAAAVIKSPAQAAAEARPPERSVLTSPVEYRVLTSSVIVRGQVVARQSVDVAPQISGGADAATPVVTKLPVTQGATVKAGQVVLEVSGRPVFVLPGRVPMYRDLKPGAKGSDVRQLQRALRALGHGTGSDLDGTFGAGTKTALNSFYSSIGYDPLPALDDGGEGVKAAQKAVTQAKRAVAEAEAAEGADADRNLGYARDDLAEARADLATAKAAAGPRLPAGEVVFLQGFPARVDSVAGRVGGPVDGRVMTVSAGRLQVRAYLQEHQKGLVHKGQRVRIYSEVTGAEARARVGYLAESFTAAGGGEDDGQGGSSGEQGAASAQQEQSGYLLRADPDRPLDAKLAGQDVRLTIEAARTDGKALVVPITALSAGADGRTTVTVVKADGRQRRVEVRTGTTGDGFVAVEPVGSARLAEGEQVVTGVKREGSGP